MNPSVLRATFGLRLAREGKIFDKLTSSNKSKRKRRFERYDLLSVRYFQSRPLVGATTNQRFVKAKLLALALVVVQIYIEFATFRERR